MFISIFYKHFLNASCFYFLKDFIYLFLEREEREGEKHQYVVASRVLPAGDLAQNPGLCPNWEWNP